MHPISHVLSTSVLIGLLIASVSTNAADLQRGKTLHDDECVMCHNNSVYTRENRKVQSLNKLIAQVKLCEGDVGAEWNPAQVEDVVNYLNASFYGFTNTTSAAQ